MYFCMSGKSRTIGASEMKDPRMTSGYWAWATPDNCSSLAQVERAALYAIRVRACSK